MQHLNRLPLIGITAMTAALSGCATIPSGRTGVEWTLTPLILNGSTSMASNTPNSRNAPST